MTSQRDGFHIYIYVCFSTQFEKWVKQTMQRIDFPPPHFTDRVMSKLIGDLQDAEV